LTEKVDEGYVIVFDVKTRVGDLCSPQEREMEGKKMLIFAVGIGR